MTQEIDVSFVMTVYNKEYYLPSVLKALLNQSGLKNPEFIFIDDLSSDKSVEIIKKMTKGISNVIIVANKENRGISPRTNQGIALAKGKYIRLLDSDDIFPIDSTAKMITLAESHKADMVYGCFSKTGKSPKFLENEYLESFTYKYSKDALRTVLKGRFTRMGQLIKTSVLKKAQGADERVFIQDESIPLRSAIHAKGIIKMTANVVLVPKEIGNFSGNKVQLDHDRFLAYAYAILDNPGLSKEHTALMYRRAVSAYWKLCRKLHIMPYLKPAFPQYLITRMFLITPDIQLLNKMKDEFLALPKVRRIQS
jgi:glycosyltransferase involved in cell wall biosynthesis